MAWYGVVLIVLAGWAAAGLVVALALGRVLARVGELQALLIEDREKTAQVRATYARQRAPKEPFEVRLRRAYERKGMPWYEVTATGEKKDG